jgi:hypothetical protein
MVGRYHPAMSSEPTNVYRLETYRFARKYARFQRSNPDSFPEFFPDVYGDSPWKPPRLAATWQPPKLIGDVRPENDFPGEGAPVALVPVFSQRAVEGLREFLEPNGELLPVLTALGTYFAYNLTTVVDALDTENSEIFWHDIRTKKWRAREVNVFRFKPRSLDGLTIFKIPQMPVAIYVTEPFVQRVRELGLNGMWITKVWPMPDGEPWMKGWMAELERVKAEDAQTRQPPPSYPGKGKAVAAPKTLDLRKDVEELRKFLETAMKQIQRLQPGWAKKGESVSAIALETSGWDLDGGPEVMFHVDTRDVFANDGHFSHFNLMTTARPKWSAFALSLESSDRGRILIDVHGEKHLVQGDSDELDAWFAGALVEAMKTARAGGMFAQLLKDRDCTICAINTDSGFGWSELMK